MDFARVSRKIKMTIEIERRVSSVFKGNDQKLAEHTYTLVTAIQ